MPARVIIRLLSGFASDLSSSTKIKMTGETQELRSDKRKPREDRQNNRYHRYHREDLLQEKAHFLSGIARIS